MSFARAESNSRPLLLVLSTLLGPRGGIPAFNALLVRAAAEYAEAGGLTLRILALTDEKDALDSAAGRELGAALQPLTLRPASYQAAAGSRPELVRLYLRALVEARFRPEVLVLGHVNLAPLGLVPGLCYGVVTHGTEVWTPLRRERAFALRRARAVACVSADTAAKVARVQGVSPSACLRIPNALPTLPALPPDRPAATSNRLRLLSVTRLYPGEPKGVDLVLRCLPGLPDAEYTVLGDGGALPGLRRLADQLGVSARVRFLGLTSDAERDAELAACDVFVLPSLGEGFGIVYLEAMARCRPCIAARCGGAPEVVLDGETGLVVEAEPAALLAALQKLAADPALRERLGAAGRRRVIDHFLYPSLRAAAHAFFAALGRSGRPASKN